MSRARLPVVMLMLALLPVSATTGVSPVGALQPTGDPDLAAYVNPFTGTEAGAEDFGTGGGAGNTFPGAVVPFGMVQWSPDTVPSTTNFAGGYTYGDTKIGGFSLTHMSGAGCASYGDVPFLPTTRPVTASPVRTMSSAFKDEFVPSFSHARELASPGYYGVTLDPGEPQAIDTELTVTERTGAARITFPGGQTGSVLVNAGGSAMANTEANVVIDPQRREVSGSAASGAFCYQGNRYKVFFAAEFDRPFKAFGTWKKDSLSPGSTTSSDVGADPRLSYQPVPGGPKSLPGDPSGTAQSGAFLSFDTRRRRTVEIRVGVSYVSVENARENLRAENPGNDFDAVRDRARASWNRMLGRVEVSGGSESETRTFYTMLYHALLHPNVFSDANGQYSGMDGKVHTTTGHTQYANFSGWDVYRSQIPLLAMLAPGRTSDVVTSLLTNARESGWLPKWSVANGHTGVMVGDSASPAIAGALAFGARGFDTAAALDAMVKGATEYGRSANAGYVERPGLLEYQQLGYVPAEREQGVYASFVDPSMVWGPASTTLEYAIADFAIARSAEDACGPASSDGCRDLYHRFMQRSATWRNLYNADTGYVEPRSASGAFLPGHDPTSGFGFVEGDGAQYTWMVPHDPAGLFSLMGGTAQAAARLDEFFRELNAGPTSAHAFLGNEPSLGAPFLYDWLGQPYKAQRVVREAMLSLYDASPTGFPGNDDLGQMASWYVFAALGMYPAVPGEDVLALSSPLFPQTVLHLAGGDVSLSAPGASAGSPYVQGLTVDGSTHDKPWLSFAELACGADLTYDLAATPDPTWGSRPADAPPSFGPDSPASVDGGEVACPDK